MNISLTRQDTLVMKGIAICAMLFHHLYACPPNSVLHYSGVLLWLGILGNVCVALFLFCSGYGLSVQYEPMSIKEDIRFVAHRLVKFYANYWVVFVIFVPITIFIFHRSLHDAYGETVNITKRFVYDLLGVQYPAYNITWWFNKLIIILYILFPLLYRLIKHLPWLSILLGIVFVYLSPYISRNPIEIWMWQFPFIIGIAWNLYEDKCSKIYIWLSNHKIIAVLGSIILLIVMIWLRMCPIIPNRSVDLIDGLLSFAIALVVICVLRHIPHLVTSFSFLGKHSMNIYLTHTFFNGYWHPEWLHNCEWLRGGGNFAVLMLICIVVSIVIEEIKEKTGIYKLVQVIISHI